MIIVESEKDLLPLADGAVAPICSACVTDD